ncbi:sigma factor-like helix-turn-helix DNA-binding protein [Streptomyces sp. G44]|uniref:sigma factor-like helix-turn-helix DNA-binding protein n=1 Tax=Streptomyces sp. G44 TaxID=2807632 RepID=UPI001EF796EB|nr:sigma factor-like helix-turn-helix DNA-binding protein [Streptomyces sp. G44]
MIGPSHQAMLERLRRQISVCGATLDDVARRSGFSKTRISALLRGIEYYPSWEITYSVVHALGLPPWPLRRLWTSGAYEAAKSTAWITRSIQAVQPLGPEERPVEHRGFMEKMEQYYISYAQALLHIERPERIVDEAFDILWAGWDEAAAGPNLSRTAWRLLRSRVLLRVRRHPDGRPDLRPAAFMTVAQSRIDEPVARFVEISEVAAFFDAISHLPPDQFDVIVLRYLCAFPAHEVQEATGLSPAHVHTLDHHARGALELLRRPTARE